ncbi:MAG: GNAT family N-acetyltransferase [Candidatus Tectomicrobia bacterium]|nr:GNAT family N-acetyltransferase [Candidatus Tectomicrobia bacterium]
MRRFLFSRVRLVLYDVDLATPPKLQEARLEARYDILSAATPEKHADLLGYLAARTVEQRFERGEDCYVAHVHDKVAAYGWVSYREAEIGELNKTMVVKPREAYLYDFVTRPEFRGQNFYPALLGRILKDLERRRYRRVYIFVLRENAASRRGVSKAGFRQFQVVTCLKILGFRFYLGMPAFFR